MKIRAIALLQKLLPPRRALRGHSQREKEKPRQAGAFSIGRQGAFLREERHQSGKSSQDDAGADGVKFNTVLYHGKSPICCGAGLLICTAYRAEPPNDKRQDRRSAMRLAHMALNFRQE
jgi:hypothetical protein